ncbi:MAG: methyltransferase [Pseudomonadota bacterium]|nr:methyltransferase [Pseudomonadota bacterium]
MQDQPLEVLSRTVLLRPGVDLTMRLPARTAPTITDLGCGSGVLGPVLRARFPKARITGVDAGAAALQEAWKTGTYDALEEQSPRDCAPQIAPDILILNDPDWLGPDWLDPEAAALIPLFNRLAPGGVLAVQMANQSHAPSHRLWLDLAAMHFADRLPEDAMPASPDAAALYDLLEPLGTLGLWETEYYHRLPLEGPGHPVRHLTLSAARTVLAALTKDEQKTLIAHYDEAMHSIYPPRGEGAGTHLLYAQKHLFFTLTRPA